MRAAFIGKTLDGHYVDGLRWTETYDADGRLDYRESARKGSGHWYFRGHVFCTFYDPGYGLNGGCWTAIKASANCYEFYIAGLTEHEPEDEAAPGPLGGWAARAWRTGRALDVRRQAECVTPLRRARPGSLGCDKSACANGLICRYSRNPFPLCSPVRNKPHVVHIPRALHRRQLGQALRPSPRTSSTPPTASRSASSGYASKGDLDKALAAVDKGFKTWRRVSAFERGKILRKAADLVRTRADEIAKVLTQEQGKILAEAKMEVLSAADIIDWFAGEGQRAYGRIIPARADGVRNMVIMEPIGPVAGFAPWNFPVTQAVRKIAASLAAGCSIIIKCPEETPGSPIGLVKCFHDAGVPPGVINLVYGVPAEISEYLIPQPDHPQGLVHRLGAGRQAPERAGRAAT